MRRARRTALLFVLLTAGMATAAAAGRYEGLDRLPGVRPVTLLVHGKQRVYFRVQPGVPVSLTLGGPARVRLLTRAEMPAGAGQSASYRLRVLENGHVLADVSTVSAPAAGVRVEGASSVVCKGRKAHFILGNGTHRVQIVATAARPILVRALIALPRTAEDMVTLTPVDAPRSVTVFEGEKMVPYYSVLPGRPVTLRVVGPTVLDLLTRLDFDATMRGTHVYRLRLVQDGRVVRVLEHKTTKAVAASYTNLPDRIPSKFDRTRLPIDSGTHTIVISLAPPAREAAEIHARIPRPTVGDEE